MSKKQAPPKADGGRLPDGASWDTSPFAKFGLEPSLFQKLEPNNASGRIPRKTLRFSYEICANFDFLLKSV